jgi:hypothetical protein
MKPFTFNTAFRQNVVMVAETLGLTFISTARQVNNGTLIFWDPQTSVKYSLHESGYVRRWIKPSIWGPKGDGLTEATEAYQLNRTLKAYVPNRTYKRTVRLLATPYEQLGIFTKAVIAYRNS